VRRIEILIIRTLNFAAFMRVFRIYIDASLKWFTVKVSKHKYSETPL